MTESGAGNPPIETTLPPLQELIVTPLDGPTNWLWSGARWWKTDFHAHSMVSFDYGLGAPDQAALKARTYQEWLLDFMRAGIDCVVLADHNTGIGIDAAREALGQLQVIKPEGYRPFALIPGVELSVHGGTHVTAVLPLETTSREVDRLLGAIGYDGAAGSSHAVSRHSLPEVIAAIAAAGGFAIAAHADAPAGLFALSEATLKQALTTPGLLAIELERPDAAPPAGISPSSLPRGRVCGSDSHHPSGSPGQAFPGSRFTWVKMTAPTHDGIRLALLDGALSLTRSDEGIRVDPNVAPEQALRAIEVFRSTYLGVGDPLRIEFSPWLNTIIGGRGTGKSTVVEFLRLALRRHDELPDDFSPEFAKYRTIQRPNGEFGLLRDDSTIQVEYVKEGTTFRITWRAGAHEREIEQLGEHGWEAAPGDVAARFPIRIYSQKQIFHLAGDARALLKIVDQSTPVDRRAWQEEQDAAQNRFLALRARAREIEAGLTREGRIRGELADTLRRIDLFEKSRYADVLREHRTRTRQNQVLAAWEKAWESAPANLRLAAEAVIPPEFPTEGFDPNSPEYVELKTAADAAREKLLELQADLVRSAEAIDAAIAEWQQAVAASAWRTGVDGAALARAALLEKLAEEGIESTKEHGELLEQQKLLEDQLLEIEVQKVEAAQLWDEASTLLGEIRDRRRSLTQRRGDFLADVLRDNKLVRVRVVPYGAVESIESEFRQAIDRDDMHFGRYIGQPGRDGLLRDIGAHLARPDRTESSLQTLKDEVGKLATGQADKTIYTDTRFTRHFEELPPERLDRLEMWFPEDSLSVTYSPDGSGRNFVAIRQASPGQKTATLLAFLLSYGSEPMVLDQPEDDLDNHLIYELIVTQLRDTKTRRQLIVVTHNPNIVVNGDAELVVALKSVGNTTALEAKGSLQDRNIRDLICRVMEGGQEAFTERYRRIALS